MAKPKRLLILGGTGEAAELAERAVGQFSSRLDVIYSLAGRLEPKGEMTANVRVGGFGGGQGLADFLISEAIDLVIDATHPFAATISANAYDACLTTVIPRLTFVRPPWDLPPGVKYLEADDMAEAARLMSGFARRVLVTTGQKDLATLAGLPGIHFTIRLIEAPQEMPDLENFTIITARPPFTLEHEVALMEELNIDCLLAKQSGGALTMAKITAAIRKRVAIVLIRRPLPEPGESVQTTDAALLWLESRL